MLLSGARLLHVLRGKCSRVCKFATLRFKEDSKSSLKQFSTILHNEQQARQKESRKRGSRGAQSCHFGGLSLRPADKREGAACFVSLSVCLCLCWAAACGFRLSRSAVQCSSVQLIAACRLLSGPIWSSGSNGQRSASDCFWLSSSLCNSAKYSTSRRPIRLAPFSLSLLRPTGSLAQLQSRQVLLLQTGTLGNHRQSLGLLAEVSSLKFGPFLWPEKSPLFASQKRRKICTVGGLSAVEESNQCKGVHSAKGRTASGTRAPFCVNKRPIGPLCPWPLASLRTPSSPNGASCTHTHKKTSGKRDELSRAKSSRASPVQPRRQIINWNLN